MNDDNIKGSDNVVIENNDSTNKLLSRLKAIIDFIKKIFKKQ